MSQEGRMSFNQNQMKQNQFRGMQTQPQSHQQPPKPVRKVHTQSGVPVKLMRLKCRFRPLQDAYLSNGEVSEKDSDVVFVCSDGNVRAHKIILACASMFFIKIFDDQKSGKLTTVHVPDITVPAMKLVLSLVYSDNVSMTPDQIKEVGNYVSLFGLSWKQFVCSDPQNPGEPCNLIPKSENPTPPPQPQRPTQQQIQQQQQQLQQRQKQQQIRQMQVQQQYQQQLNPRLQQQLSQGHVSIKPTSSGSGGMVFTSGGGNQLLASKLQGSSQSLLKPKHQDGHTSENSDNGSDYKFKIQGYEGQRQGQGQVQVMMRNPNRQSQQMQQQQVQVRPLKQLLSGGQVQLQSNKGMTMVNQTGSGFRRIAPKPISQQQQQQHLQSPGDGEMDLYGGVSDQLEIQMDTEDSAEDESLTVDPESRIMIDEWVKNLGRDSQVKQGGSSKSKPVPSAAAGHPRQKQQATNALPNQCMICNNVFDDDSKWHWHETHHVGLGIFKCAFCDELFSTSRKVYQHEMMEHGVQDKDGPADPPSIPDDFQIVNGRKRKLSPLELDGSPQGDSPHSSSAASAGSLAAAAARRPQERMTLVRTLHGSHYRKLPTFGGPNMKRKIVLSKFNRGNVVTNIRARNPLIGIAHIEDEDCEETRKIRQLHWIYVCSRCEHGVDSSQKAMLHYKQCYPDEELPFEKTVVKYRQGFYGKIKCPICPRRYTSAAGFKIHCGHMHVDYRRKFSHSNADDTIICRNCRKRFTDPVDFHYHLSDGECYETPDFSANETPGGRWVGNGNPGEGEESNGPPKLKKEKISPAAAAAAAGAVSTPTPAPPPPAPHSSSSLSRSTRLTNRILMNSEDGQGGESKFTPVTCPVCTQPEVEKIVEHLQTEHSGLDVLVSRVGNALLKCQKCRITFSLGDLLTHMEKCEGTKQFQYVSERRAAQPGSKAKVSGPTAEGTSIAIPPGIGCSPVDKIECEDLSSVATLKAAMHCGVCGKHAKKLGAIADCLRSHGINRCALCFNTYKEKSVYSAHLRQAHGAGGGRLCCPLCTKTFINAGQVAGHMYSSHWLTLLRSKELSGGSSKDNDTSKTEEEDGDRAILAAVGLTATPGAAPRPRASDDYSSITIGSILSTENTPQNNNTERRELDLENCSMNDLIGSNSKNGENGDTETSTAGGEDEEDGGLQIDEANEGK